MNTERLFSDDAVDGTEDAPDVLGRHAYAKHVVALLERVRGQSESSVLAMIAPWGAGKSSVLAMTISLLKARGGRRWLACCRVQPVDLLRPRVAGSWVLRRAAPSVTQGCPVE